MSLFSSLYERVMRWSKHPKAVYWLSLVSFTESSCFLIPPDVMLAPMTLAKPQKAWFYALITTVMSVLGGLLGYAIGSFAFQAVEPLLISWGYQEAYITATQWFTKWGFWAILLAGFSPIPYKVFTIAAGVAAMPIIPFFIGSIIGRGSRFFLVAGLMRWGGEELEGKLRSWIDWIGWVTILLIAIAYIVLKY
ncbi:MAG: DedA family protein [Gammaproteobacteria bacterium]|nr:MAG: DedA family protein [Gammaproteobacteria bacterium]